MQLKKELSNVWSKSKLIIFKPKDFFNNLKKESLADIIKFSLVIGVLTMLIDTVYDLIFQLFSKELLIWHTIFPMAMAFLLASLLYYFLSIIKVKTDYVKICQLSVYAMIPYFWFDEIPFAIHFSPVTWLIRIIVSAWVFWLLYLGMKKNYKIKENNSNWMYLIYIILFVILLVSCAHD